MGWASRFRKGLSVGLVGEDGKPLPDPEPPNDPPEPKDEKLHLPVVTITMHEDGRLGIDGPSDIRLTLSMLHEATDMVLARFASNVTMLTLAKAQTGLRKPSLRESLAVGRASL